MLIELKGINSKVTLYKDRIIIMKKGAPKTVYLSQISNIQVKTGSLLTNGYIQFSLSGENKSAKSTNKMTSDFMDENTIIFMKRENELALKMKTEIERLK
jgi:hypothetical protein